MAEFLPPKETRHDEAAPATAHKDGASAPLLPPEERDRLALRLREAANSFVDNPRGAVEEADHVLEEAMKQLTDTFARRRRELRTPWLATGPEDEETVPGGAAGGTADTEQLRLALRDYRETAERLLDI